MKSFKLIAAAIASLAMAGCTADWLDGPDANHDGETKILLAGQIEQEYKTRVNDDGFADGDQMGVYIVDFQGENAGTLLSSGNRGDNVRHTFNAEAYSWESAYDVYWKDKHTRIDVYGYYPFVSSISDVNNYAFAVSVDQAAAAANGSLGGYEASDFLWGKVAAVEPTDKQIKLPLAHKLANARVTLVEGEGFADGEWADLSKQVLVTNTVQECAIDLSTGAVKAGDEVGRNSIIPARNGSEWRAIVVPQTVPSGTTMFSITIGGIPYKFAKSEDFTYVSGKMGNFAIRVDKKTPTGDYALTLISESITPWENDLVSHDATMKEYVIVDVPVAGTLKECIAAAGKDLAKMRNLKITGHIDARDFAVMREEMPMLGALNLKDVQIDEHNEWPYEYDNRADEIPGHALANKESLITLVLPDRLKYIGGSAFCCCTNLSGSLIIPEGVESIESAAFQFCTSLTGTLSLPSTLTYLGDHLVFAGCNFTCELKLPENLRYIGYQCFDGCNNLYGPLRLPEHLEHLGNEAFRSCENLSGNLEIPQSLKIIPNNAFNGCALGGTLTLHDGITAIGEGAFASCFFKGELRLPKNLEVISHYAFWNNNFSGTLVLPAGLRTIGDKCFAFNWRLMGTLEIPENVISIGAGAFAQCWGLEGVIFPEGLESIRSDTDMNQEVAGAFQNCYGIGKIVCKGSIPPYVQGAAFNGVAKDNFVLEVPESAVAAYQTAVGWMEFKRISAHHELVCRPQVACALSNKHTQTLIVDAEGDWELASKPDWCELSKTSGFKKTEITLTINDFASTDGMREGDVVFRLKGKDYTTLCHVKQRGYVHKEDEFLTLQSATRGNRGGINIVILGDGYDADDIADGQYLADMREEIEYFFGIEPYATYRDYFNVYAPIVLSTESGVGSVNTIRYNHFSTTATGGMGYRCEYGDLISYILNAPTVNSDNLKETLAIVVPNSTDYGGICQMWDEGFAIAFCPKSDFGYPEDSRGVIQHEAGGHGFGKLGDEYIYHNAFIDFCGCTCCDHVLGFQYCKALGWYDNLELTGKMHQVGWSHLIFDPRYSDIVDIYEGGYMHNRGVFRSEQNSCMNNDIPYYSTISRQSIVRRIKRYAGETFDFEEFVANDKRGAAQAKAMARSAEPSQATVGRYTYPPQVHKGNPMNLVKSKRK